MSRYIDFKNYIKGTFNFLKREGDIWNRETEKVVVCVTSHYIFLACFSLTIVTLGYIVTPLRVRHAAFSSLI
jgi:hypothetical protein